MKITIAMLKMNKRGMAEAAISIIKAEHARCEQRHHIIPLPGETYKRELTDQEIADNCAYRIGHAFLEQELKRFPLSFLKGVLRPKLNRVIEAKTIKQRIIAKDQITK